MRSTEDNPQGSDPTPANRYKIRQQMISIGKDFYVETADGQQAFFVDGKVLALQETFVIQDMKGHEMATIQERRLALRETMDIYRGGRVIATVRKAWIKIIGDRYLVDRKGAPDWEVRGNLFDREYGIYEGSRRIAQISKGWFSLTDTYGIDVLPGLDDALIIAVCIVIDEANHDLK
jgi:uncharacterized protein YxjI